MQGEFDWHTRGLDENAEKTAGCGREVSRVEERLGLG
jgi:hypothetical protein